MLHHLSTVWFNYLCFIIHGAFGAWLLIESAATVVIEEFATKVDIVYLRCNMSEWPEISYRVDKVGTMNLPACLSAFSFITCFAHLLYARIPTLSLGYRYYEYALTAPIMIAIIIVLFGIRDVFLIITICVLICVTMFFGILQVNHKDSVNAHIYGWVPYSFAWGVIISSYLVVEHDNDNIPHWVVFILIAEAALFSLFGIVQLKFDVIPKLNGGYNSITNADREADGWNNLLSLISKATLVIVLYGNLLNLKQNQDS